VSPRTKFIVVSLPVRPRLPGPGAVWGVVGRAIAASDSLGLHYYRARAQCGCGRAESVRRAVYAQRTGRWPW
jgi:hypothetical protein